MINLSNFLKLKERKPDAKGILEVEAGWIEDGKFWALHKNASPEKMKIKFYNQKILDLIYPGHFPNIVSAGYIKDLEKGFSIRHAVDSKETGNPWKDLAEPSIFFGDIKKNFEQAGLDIDLDFKLENATVDKKDDKFKYLDTINAFIKSEEDISKLLKFAKDKNVAEENLNKIETYAKRALINFRNLPE